MLLQIIYSRMHLEIFHLFQCCNVIIVNGLK